MSDTPDISPEPSGEEISSSNVAQSADLLADLSVEKRAELIQLVSQIEVYGSFSGPLPPPNVLNLYDIEARQAIVSGFSANGNHRRKSESRGQLFFFIRDILSLLAAFVLALILIIGSIDTIQQGQSTEGLLGIGTTVSLVVGAFVVREHRQRRERDAERAPAVSSGLPEKGESKPN
ncbi:MAG: hypothetical protein OXT68_00395 [Chloroflexota bacterium]|nr:hypothetical protein [Chloroflexota bacterium]